MSCSCTRLSINRRDLADLVVGQRVEDDRRVDAIQELRPEQLLERIVHLLAHIVGVQLAAGVEAREADPRGAPDMLGADVRGHDNDRVAEIDPPALAIGQWPSSSTWSSRLNASGWAFSISSNSTTE